MKLSYQKFLAIIFFASLLLLAASLPTQAQSGLSPKEVQSWCTEVQSGSGTCDISNFTQLQEFNGAINPNGVHFKAKGPAKFNVPAGISVDVWDCFNASKATGPVILPQVCEASFRKTG